MDVDLYELIGATRAASVQEIKKAYRKKALSCHPDKNPDNPKAAELFHELSRALEILTDAAARAAYDKVIEARHQAKLRTKEFDAKRRKLKEDLEAREEAYKRSLNPQYSAKTDEDRLKAEIERLQKEGSKQVEEEIAFVKRKIQEQLRESMKRDEEASFKIKIKWKTRKDSKPAYNYDSLYQIFSKYGDIGTLVVSPTRDGRALIEFRTRTSAETALKTEVGFAQNPLTLERLWTVEKPANDTFTVDEGNGTAPPDERIPFATKDSKKTEFGRSRSPSRNSPVNQTEMSDAEFERSVLNNLKRAQERKRNLEKTNLEEGT